MSGKTYVLRSAPCGDTAEYCLGADGHNITAGGTATGIDYNVSVGGVSYDYQTHWNFICCSSNIWRYSFTSFSFSKSKSRAMDHRLLATAYNDWAAFGVDGTVTFGNGVVHGYSTDYGHGIMDIYQALQPILTNMNGRTIYTSMQITLIMINYKQVEVLKIINKSI